jgi:hypothetical protein
MYHVITEVLPCKILYGGNVISVAYSEFVSVALFTQQVMRIGHAIICDLSGSRIFFHIIS